MNVLQNFSQQQVANLISSYETNLLLDLRAKINETDSLNWRETESKLTEK
jgi:hypothetical protein